MNNKRYLSHSEKYWIIVSNIYPGKTVREQDEVMFSKWADGLVSTEETLAHFKKNNAIDESIVISEDLFVQWLRTLGYFR